MKDETRTLRDIVRDCVRRELRDSPDTEDINYFADRVSDAVMHRIAAARIKVTSG